MRHGDRSTSPLSAYGNMGRFLVSAKDHGKGQSKNKESPLRSSSRCLARFENSFPRFPFDSQCSWVEETVCNYLLTAMFIDIVKVWS